LNSVGQRERATQNRVKSLFRERLGYDYLGDWQDRPDNRNIEEAWLKPFLAAQGCDEALVNRVLFELAKAAGDQSRGLTEVNRAVYDLLRYGVKVKTGVGETTRTVWLIDWEHPERNHFAIAEEVTVRPADPSASTKRPDIVIYVNGLALGVLELKRSTVSVEEGIRQNLDNQTKRFIQPFFATQQLVMAGNDTQGLRYGTVETTATYYLTWKEESSETNPLDRALLQMCDKRRFLELIHDFTVFDSGVKKLCRPNQYFGVRAAQDHIHRRQGGIIWHTQGSGKSLTMVWLAKWIREHVPDARVLIITDRTELDEQIEGVFAGVNESLHRAKSGADLIARLNDTAPWLIGSLVHKFGARDDADVEGYVEDLRRAMTPGFRAKGDLIVFVDECHRTQSGELHKAMKAILPDALFIGFTGTPLLKTDKRTSLETFGPYIHTYRFDEAVRDGVVLDLRYEARDIDQYVAAPAKIDEWFEIKTRGLNDLAKAQLKQRWGTLKKVLSSQSRLEMIVNDIMIDMAKKDRLISGRGNAMLVSGSIYQACKFYELFEKTDLAGKCAIVTSYKPSPADIKGEETGEGLTEKLRQYDIHNRMLAGEDPNKFEKAVKERFIKEPGRMKLLIVVDKLLTGFDAPSATYLYIDKTMQDHGLFQAICRVNRLDGDDKAYGAIIDYKDLFRSLENSIRDYTSGALDGYEREDVEGLLKDRVGAGVTRLEDALEAVRALCEPVEAPRDTQAYMRFFGAANPENKDALKEGEPKRLLLYKLTAELLRAYADIVSDLPEAGYGAAQIAAFGAEVGHYEKVRDEVKVASGDYIDLKAHEPAMRHLIDTYIRAEDSRTISTLDDMSLIQLIVERGVEAVEALPKGIRDKHEAVAETIENNVRKLIIDETPVNPRYYERMSDLLSDLIEQRRQAALSYEEYLAKIVALTKLVADPSGGTAYPPGIVTAAQRALFDNFGQDSATTLAIDADIRAVKKDNWRGNVVKEREVRNAIRVHVGEPEASFIFDLVMQQSDY